MPDLTHRYHTVERADSKSDLIDISIASDTPVERYYGMEILDVRGVDARRAVGMPVLTDHQNTVGSIAGRVESVYPRGNQVRATIRLDTEGKGAEIRGLLDRGMLSNVSVGYTVDETDERKGATGEMDTHTITRWTLYEVSFVAVPADPSVGVGRSQQPKEHEMTDQVPETREVEEDSRAPIVIAKKERNLERERIVEMTARGREYEDVGGPEIAEEVIRDGGDMRMLNERINEALVQRYQDREREIAKMQEETGKEINRSADLGLSQSDLDGFSFVRAFDAIPPDNAASANPKHGFELEVLREANKLVVERNLRPVHGPFTVPLDVLRAPCKPIAEVMRRKRLADVMQQRALAAGSGSGANIVETALLAGSFIEMLYNVSCILPYATFLPGLVGDIAIPRQTASISTAWMDESAAATPADMTIDQVTMSPKEVQAYTVFSRKLAIQSTPEIEYLVRQDMAAGIAVAIDYAALIGSGTGSQPKGAVVEVKGSHTHDLAGNTSSTTNTGDFHKFSDYVELESLVAESNAQGGEQRYVMRPRRWGVCKTTPKEPVKTTTSGAAAAYPIYIADGDGMINGYPVVRSTQMPKDATVGTKSDADLDTVLFGDLSQILIGMWSGLDIMTDPYTKLANRQIAVSAVQDVDVAVRRADYFAKMQNIRFS